MLSLITIFVNIFVLVFAAMVFVRVGINGKIFLIVTIVLSAILPFLFGVTPTAYFLHIITHVLRFLIGIGCYFYLKMRGEI